MMAKQNTFLCNCGRVIGRPLADRLERRGFRWDFVPGDWVQVGIQCSCRKHYLWIKPQKGHPYVNVTACDKHQGKWKCEC